MQNLPEHKELLIYKTLPSYELTAATESNALLQRLIVCTVER